MTGANPASQPQASRHEDLQAIQILYLAVCDIETRDKARGGEAKKKSILSRGSTTHGWTAALNQFAILFPGRLPALI